jgi:hypothetical protein
VRIEIVEQNDDVIIRRLVVLPRRWVVKRTFSCFGRYQRLAKDFENLAETLASHVPLASIQLALRRVARGVGRELNKLPLATHVIVAHKRERFPLPSARGRCRFGQGTFAGAPGNDEVAPFPAIRRLKN